MYKIWAYRKKNEPLDELDALLNKVQRPKCEYCEVYTDLEKNHIAYEQMKSDIENNEGILIVKALGSLGDSMRSICEELEWIKSRDLTLVVLDYPSTHMLTKKANARVLAVMVDLVRAMKDGRLPDKEYAGNAKGGRPKVPYPDHWDELYQQWKAGSLTAGEFLKKSGLKKGTFYHLIVDYKEATAQMIERRRIS